MNYIKNFLKSNVTFEILAIFFTLTLVYQWFVWHNKIAIMLFSKKWFSAVSFLIFNNIYPIIIGLPIILLFYLYLKKKSKNNITSIKISFISFLLYFTTFSSVSYFLIVYKRLLYPSGTPAISTGFEYAHIKNFFSLFISQVFWICIATIAFFLLGNIIYNFFVKKYVKSEIDNITLFLIKSAIGIAFWSFIVFFLAVFSMFYKINILIILFTIFILDYRTILKIFKLSIKKITLRIEVKTYSYWTVMLFFLFLNIILLNSLQSFSSGFDNMTMYLNISNLISNSHSLISGYNSYTFSLLASIGFLFMQNATFAIANQIIYGILGLLALFKLSFFFTKNSKLSFLLSFLWLTLPLTFYYFAVDTKVELLLFFFSTIATLLFFKWIQSKDNIYLYLTAFFLGFSISIKVLIGFLIIPFIPIMLYIIYKQKSTYAEKIKTIFIVMIISILVYSPWLVYNLSTSKNSDISIDSLIISKNIFNTGYLNTTDLENRLNISSCNDTSIQEDIGRFQSNSNFLLKPFVIPLEILKNKHNKLIINIGFIPIVFYGLFFLFALFFLIKRKKISKKIAILIFVTIFYWLLWGIFAKEILWYGFSGFPIYFSLMSALLLHTLKNYTSLYKLLVFLIFINIIINISSLSKNSLQYHTVQYISKRETNLHYQQILDILNSKENANKVIYMTSDKMIYFINNNNERVFLDNSLGYFSCLSNNYTYTDVRDYFKNELNVDYVLFTLGKPTVTHSENTLTQKAIIFYDFAKHELKSIKKINDRIELFEIK